MPLSAGQKETIGGLIEQLRPLEIEMDRLRDKGAYKTVRTIRAQCYDLQRQIDDVLATIGLPRGERWGTGVDDDD